MMNGQVYLDLNQDSMSNYSQEGTTMMKIGKLTIFMVLLTNTWTQEENLEEKEKCRIN